MSSMLRAPLPLILGWRSDLISPCRPTMQLSKKHCELQRPGVGNLGLVDVTVGQLAAGSVDSTNLVLSQSQTQASPLHPTDGLLLKLSRVGPGRSLDG